MSDIERIISHMNRDNLTLDENETTFTQTGDNRGVWRVFTNDLVWIRRLHARGARLVRYDQWGVAFDLDDNQVRIFQPLTDEQRQRMAASLRAETSEKPPY